MKHKKFSVVMFLLLLVLMAFLALSGCTTIEEHHELDPKVLYMPDLDVTIDGKKYGAWGVAPLKDKMQIQITAPGDIDLLKITTCARQKIVQGKEIKYFRNKYLWIYEPMDPLETSGSCGMITEAYEAGIQGRHSWATFDFKTSEETIKAKGKCCGQVMYYDGVSACACAEGLKAKITFDEPVYMLTDEKKCIDAMPMPDNKLDWNYNLANRECIYLFYDSKGEIHRHTTIGWEAVPIRKDH